MKGITVKCVTGFGRSRNAGFYVSNRATTALTFAGVVTCVVMTGCASLKLPNVVLDDDLAGERQQRKQDVASDLEHRRDQAQLAVALARWEQGDSAACEAALLDILQRSPSHKEARRSLADLYTERDDTDQALRQLEILLEHDSQDAQAHHSMGLLLESIDRTGDAAPHLARAVQLEPDNRIFALSQRTILAPVSNRNP